MAPVAKKGRKRRRKKNVKSSQTSFLMQSLGAIILIILVIFLKTANVISNGIAIAICMIVLLAMFYVMFIGQSKPKRRRRKKGKKPESKESEPQFYTALPSTLGLTDTSETLSKSPISLPPRPITPVKRQRNFITYPLALGGGDYSDSYVQIDKETVLRLRTVMTPDSQSLKLPGARISSFEDALVQSEDITPTIAEAAPVVAEAAPVVAEAAPVVAEAAPLEQKDDEEEEMEFDLEWD